MGGQKVLKNPQWGGPESRRRPKGGADTFPLSPYGLLKESPYLRSVGPLAIRPGVHDAIAALYLAPAAFCAYAPGPPCAEKPRVMGCDG